MEAIDNFLKCTDCNRLFFTKTGFKIHNSKHHSEEEETKRHVSVQDKCLEIQSPTCNHSVSLIEKEKTIAEKSKKGSTVETPLNFSSNESSQSKGCSELMGPVVGDTSKHGTVEKIADQDFSEKENQGGIYTLNKQRNASVTNLKSEIKTSSNQLKDGRRAVDATPRKHSCEICKQVFNLKCNLNRHIKNIHEKIKPFQCNICPQVFGYKKDFQNHKSAVHEKNKPFHCHICQKSFGYKQDYRKHTVVVHEKTKSFKCQLCQKSFGWKTYLQMHTRVVHNKNM